jgi:pantoate--beta-alanine ligase
VRVITSAAAFADALEAERATGRRVGLVPTMGALHAGHRSLVERAAAQCDVVAVTVFVNPLQFTDASDLARYPRDLRGDVALAEAAGAQIVFAPSVPEMYPGFPAPVPTSVRVAGVSEGLEGASRPGHFDGVATVVAKLFSLAGRCRAYFGEKDFQQLAVVRRMVADLSIPVEVIGCPTVREPDGLALSSRNVRLSPPARVAALALRRALDAGLAVLAAGERHGATVETAMARALAGDGLVEPDYAVVVDDATLHAPDGGHELAGEVRLLVAAVVGGVRLIDNDGVVLDAPAPVRGARPGGRELVGAMSRAGSSRAGSNRAGSSRAGAMTNGEER